MTKSKTKDRPADPPQSNADDGLRELQFAMAGVRHEIASFREESYSDVVIGDVAEPEWCTKWTFDAYSVSALAESYKTLLRCLDSLGEKNPGVRTVIDAWAKKTRSGHGVASVLRHLPGGNAFVAAAILYTSTINGLMLADLVCSCPARDRTPS